MWGWSCHLRTEPTRISLQRLQTRSTEDTRSTSRPASQDTQTATVKQPASLHLNSRSQTFRGWQSFRSPFLYLQEESNTYIRSRRPHQRAHHPPHRLCRSLSKCPREIRSLLRLSQAIPWRMSTWTGTSGICCHGIWLRSARTATARFNGH